MKAPLTSLGFDFGGWMRALLAASILGSSVPAEADYQVGLAKVDITPDYPVRLSGFGFRRIESEGVTQRIWAKALAIQHDQSAPAVLITVDNLGIPVSMLRRIEEQLETTSHLPPGRVAVTATHTHTAPMISEVAPTLFGMPIPSNHLERIQRYTHELQAHLHAVTQRALENLQPGSLEFGIGEVGFARNRRTKGGPVDHDLPTLFARDARGKIIGIYTNYACHCVTLSHNKIGGDWAGYAQTALERNYPGATALIAMGCGADANPDSGVVGDDTATAARQGEEIANGVAEVLDLPRQTISGPISINTKTVQLPFAPPRSESEWRELAKRKDAVGYHAKVNLERLENNRPIQTTLEYPIQTWQFGSSMAWVMLPGEVVVDYALRLKRELDESKVWITAYANDAPCYIPSERILQEGGYEGAGAMVYYDRPGKFAPGLEDVIVQSVHSQLADTFRPPPGTDGIAPKSPEESLQCFRTHPEFEVELVVSEPLVIDPVAIDWDIEGNLWVAEMHDYPLGMGGKYEPGGRVKRLIDTDGDGQYDQAHLFADGIPFPTGIMATSAGILIGAAPDILLAKDEDQDGRADTITKLFSGFADHNYQARVNSFQWGLDNWIHAANGLFGGEIRSPRHSERINTRGRDLRFRIGQSVLQTVSGLSQQGRVRDDWGNWFGCQNGVLLQHYPLLQHYLDDAPELATPPANSLIWRESDPGRLFPISKPLTRFNDVSHQGRVTSACGVGIYRDHVLGEEYYGNAFTCEPVHNLVRRTVLSPENGTFAAERAQNERKREFLSSTDHWFRPAQALTGPDGALWIVDMYRFLMEHPIWIRPERLAELDPRAGDQQGRLYRVVRREGKHSAPIFAAKPPSQWIDEIQSSNGPRRDLAQQAIVEHTRRDLAPALRNVVFNAPDPAVRIQALCTLAGIGEINGELLERVLTDSAAAIRKRALELAENLDELSPVLESKLETLARDPDPVVRLQLGYSLAKLKTEKAPRLLATLLTENRETPYLEIGALASCRQHLRELVEVLEQDRSIELSERQWNSLLSIDLASGSVFKLVAGGGTGLSTPATLRLVSKHWRSSSTAEDLAEQSRERLETNVADRPTRLASIDILGRQPNLFLRDEVLLAKQLNDSAPAIQKASIEGLARIGTESALKRLWQSLSALGPEQRAFAHARMIEQKDWLKTVLKEDGAVDFVRQINAVHRQQLRNHSDMEIRSLASQLLHSPASGNLQQLLSKYTPAGSLRGDPINGRTHFEARCGQCHTLDGIGSAIGPDLRELTDRSFESVLLDIIHPNRMVLDQYQAYEIETTQADVLSGLVTAETRTHLTLLTADNQTHRLARDQIVHLRTSGKSLMPEGLEEGLSLQDMADLIAFINQANQPPPPPRDPATIAAYLLAPSTRSTERRAAIEVHYALADRLLPHLLKAVDGEPAIYELGHVTGRRNEPRTLPSVAAQLGAALDQDKTALAAAGFSGLLAGLATHEAKPLRTLQRHLKVPQQVKLWTTAAETDSAIDPPFPGTPSNWNGFLRFDFKFNERPAIVVTPHRSAQGNPWIWRARFFGHEPQLDLKLLEAGYHLVYSDVADLFGSPKAVTHWNAFYQYLVGEHQFHPKAVLEGMSRGGLIIYNWARANPKKVRFIYADAPVLDFKTWPGGERRSVNAGQQKAWEKLLAAYEFKSDQEALSYRGNPVDHQQFLIDHDIPVFHICGDVDEVVPYATNTGVFKERYHRLGGLRFREIVKPHIGHHPHSIDDPLPLSSAILEIQD